MVSLQSIRGGDETRGMRPLKPFKQKELGIQSPKILVVLHLAAVVWTTFSFPLHPQKGNHLPLVCWDQLIFH